MDADGAAEELFGEAFGGRRDEGFLVGKVPPANATRARTIASSKRSPRRLGTDRIDPYLPRCWGRTPLAETLDAFATLRRAGEIRH